MKLTQTVRSAIVVAGLAFIGAAATLPLSIESMRSHDRPARTVGKVTLICFDQHMRANSCDVATPTAVAVQR